MHTMSASDVKQRFGACVEAAQAEPVLVERSGRPSVVVMSIHEYQRLAALEDSQWALLAKKVLEEGFLPPNEADAWFKQMQGRLNAT